MTEKYSRAQRRADYARLKTKRQYHWGYGHIAEWMGRTPPEAGEINFMAPAQAGSVVDTPKPCSCYMCRNLRSNGWADHKLTMQERRAEEDFDTQVNDLAPLKWHDDEYYYDEQSDYDWMYNWFDQNTIENKRLKEKYYESYTEEQLMWEILKEVHND